MKRAKAIRFLPVFYLILILLVCPQPARSERIRVAFGSCIQRPDSTVWEGIQKVKPTFLALLGDTVYLTQGELRNRNAITQKHEALFQDARFSQLVSKLPTFAIWDDHDFGPNNSDSLFRGSALTRSVFLNYWSSVNARSAKLLGAGIEKFSPGTQSSAFALSYKKVLFLFTDSRSFRVNPSSVERDLAPGPPTLFGESQFQWIERKIRFSKERLVVILSGSQVIPSKPQEENLANYPQERERLLGVIARSRVPVVVLSGDMHLAESYQRQTGKWNVVEITSSPLSGQTSPVTKARMQPHRRTLYVGAENFGVLDINTAKLPRFISASIHSKKGGKLMHISSNLMASRPPKKGK